MGREGIRQVSSGPRSASVASNLEAVIPNPKLKRMDRVEPATQGFSACPAASVQEEGHIVGLALYAVHRGNSGIALTAAQYQGSFAGKKPYVSFL